MEKLLSDYTVTYLVKQQIEVEASSIEVVEAQVLSQLAGKYGVEGFVLTKIVKKEAEEVA